MFNNFEFIWSFKCFRFVFDQSETQKFTLLMYFAWTMTTICDILLLVHMEVSRTFSLKIKWNVSICFSFYWKMDQLHNAIVTLIKPIYLLIWVIFLLFVLCETADNVKNRFIEISIYENCDWYTFPIDLQRKMIILTENAQRPALIQAFGNVECTREIFKKVNLNFLWLFSIVCFYCWNNFRWLKVHFRTL